MEIEARNVRQPDYDRFEKCLMDIFNCQEGKPKVKNLTLEFGYNQKNLPLSLVHRFVDENSNLKSLSLLGVNNEVTIIQDLLKILNCNHALEEFKLGGRLCRDSVLGQSNWQFIHRAKFPDLIEELKKILNEKLMAQNFSCTNF